MAVMENPDTLTPAEMEGLTRAGIATPKVREPKKARVTSAQKKAQKAARREASKKAMEEAVGQLLTSEGWKAWAKMRSTFHRYSLNNTLLILSQFPQATQVASFDKWKKLDRQVIGGSKGIKIWVPGTTEDEDGNKRVFFFMGNVFDISQTEGEPLPEIPMVETTGDSHGAYLAPLTAFAETIGYSVTIGKSKAGTDGYCNATTKKIVVSSDLPVNAQVATLIHEVAHALGVGYTDYGREAAEVIVETVAYIVTRGIGLDTSGSSVPYVASWASDGDLDAIKLHAKKVDELCREIEKAIDKVEIGG